MFDFTGSYTDQYQLTMAQVYFLKGHHHQPALFDYFFRTLPFNSGYAIFAGLADVLALLEQLHFNEQDLNFLHAKGMHPKFLNYLQDFRFKGTVYACLEGEVVFPTSPIVTIEGTMIEAQLIETLLLNLLNFQTLIATKARRIREIAGDRILMDFGLRRAQGPGGYYASRAAVIGGFDSTSNVRAGRDYSIPISGTMAHSFVQSYESELKAFRDFAAIWPDRCTLLVDTYSTLESGLPNAIQVGKEIEQAGHRLQGIRLDSGDLEQLAKTARKMLDEAGLHYVKIIASNQLDEEKIKKLLEQKAPIDAFGVGTHLAIGAPDAALDGVYKLAFFNGTPRLKLSETAYKITLPGKKQVYRLMQDGIFSGTDVIAMSDETTLDALYSPFEFGKKIASIKKYPKEPLLHKVMEQGKILVSETNLNQSAEFSKKRMQRLPNQFKKWVNPEVYQVGLSSQLNTIRDQLIKKYRS